MVYTVWLCYVVLSILKNLCGVFNFYIFQPFISLVVLCVGEIREAPTCPGCVGHYSCHVFLTSACVSGQHLLFRLRLPTLLLLFSRVTVFTLFTPSVPISVSSSVERKTTCGSAGGLLEPRRNDLCMV